MASTNKTPNFDLSQYIGSDKPTYLGDYNSDMSKIDTAMATNKTNSENAVTVATGANETASNAQTIATQAQTTAQQANTLAQTAKTAADTAQAGVNENTANIEKFNLTQFSKPTPSVSNATLNNSSIQIATNSDGSIGKIYGRLIITGISSNDVTITIPTNLRPTEQILIPAHGLRFRKGSNWNLDSTQDITIKTNGDVVITVGGNTSNSQAFVCFFQSLLFMTNFNSSPSE